MPEITSARSQFSPIRTDPTLAKNMFIFFLVVNWLTIGFAYATLTLNWLTYCGQTILEKSRQRTSK